jgi:3-oxoacyl-[acyl-carrier-protein] synthase III
VKEAVFPFARFPGVDPVLGPEMKSTGEVMGIDADFATAFAKSQLAASTVLPQTGRVFISVKDSDKPQIIDAAREKLNIDPAKIYVNIDRYGNSSAGSVPLCLDELWRAGKITKGKPFMMVAFGGGLTWASSVWNT